VPELDSTQSSDGLFGAFFEHARAPLLIIDDDLRVIRSNPAAAEFLQLRVDDLLVDGFWSVSVTAVKRLIEGVRRGVAMPFVSARTALDRLVDVDAFVISGEEQHVGIIVTDRASVDLVQRRLKDQEERYRSLFEWSPVPMREEDFSAVGVWLDRLRVEGITDLEKYMEMHPEEVRRAIMSIRTSRVNAATVDLLKAPSVLAILRGFRDDELTPQVLDAFRAQFVTLWEGGSEYSSDFVGLNFLGQPFECRLRWIVPKTGKGRDLSRVAVSLLDLTQLRATERRLQRLVADKDRFIASVSHELRTPLAAVLGLSEEMALNFEKFEEEETRELIGLVAAQSAELSAIVEDLLVAANLESGRVAINSEPVGLIKTAEDAVADCMRTVPGLKPVPVAGPDLTARGDLIRVRQIIRNLVTNAIRYGGSTIEVRIGGEGHPYVDVIDDGEGVALEHRESIFVPYYQERDKESVLGSLGLGLSISRELARRMGGDLTYRYSDEKSVFRLQLLSA